MNAFTVLLVSLGLGGLASLGMAPYHLWTVTVAALVGVFWAYRSSDSPRFSGCVIFAFTYGYFAWGLRWVSEALAFFPTLPPPLVPLAMFGIPFVLALPYGLAAYGIRRLVPRYHATWVMGVAWVGIDFLRGYVVLPFPWLFIGGIFGENLPILQITSFIGIMGLTALILASVHFFLHSKKVACITVLVWVLVWVGGYVILRGESPVQEKKFGNVIALIQPSWTQKDKAMGFYTQDYQNRLLDLSQNAVLKGNANLIIWPETAIYQAQWADPFLQESLKSLLAGGRFLMLGVSAKEKVNDHIYGANQIWVVNERLERVATYTKRNLVPFGEYVPLISSLPFVFLNQQGMQNFMAGPSEISSLLLPDFPPVSPQICYESLFSGRIVTRGASWMVNVTNDAWFGSSWGPYQHFYQARVRSIEEGIPMLRVANTGITAIIDARGRVVSQLPMNTAGVLVGSLPLERRPTLFARFGLGASFLFVLSLFFLCYRVSKR